MDNNESNITHEDILDLFAGMAHKTIRMLANIEESGTPMVPASIVKEMLADSMRLVQGAVAGKMISFEELKGKMDYISALECTCNHISDDVEAGKTFDELKLDINEHFKKHLERDATSEELHTIYDRTKEANDRSNTIESMMAAVGEALFGDQEPDSPEQGKHLH